MTRETVAQSGWCMRGFADAASGVKVHDEGKRECDDLTSQGQLKVLPVPRTR